MLRLIAPLLVVGDSRIVDKHINLLELGGQRWNKVLDFLRVADIQLHGENLDALADLRLNFRRELIQRFKTARSHDDLEVVGRGARKLLGSALANTGRSTSDEDSLAFEALGHCGRHGSSDNHGLNG